MVHSIKYAPIESIPETTMILSPEEIDERLRNHCTSTRYFHQGNGYKAYLFWRLLYDGIPLQRASTFKFMDLDLTNLSLTYRKRVPGKPTKTVATYLLSNITGDFLDIRLYIEGGTFCPKHYQRATRRIFPSRRHIETLLQTALKSVGVFIPNWEIPHLEFPALERDMDDWREHRKTRGL